MPEGWLCAASAAVRALQGRLPSPCPVVLQADVFLAQTQTAEMHEHARHGILSVAEVSPAHSSTSYLPQVGCRLGRQTGLRHSTKAGALSTTRHESHKHAAAVAAKRATGCCHD